MGIKELEKPRNTVCPHSRDGVCCTIYDARPRECALFYCTWLYAPDLGAHWRPAECGMVLHYDPHSLRMEVHVDEARPQAWREAPFYDELKAWARASAPVRGQVIVWIGEQLTAILPDRDKPLGEMRTDQLLVSMAYQTLAGVSYDIEVMDKDDARLQNPAQ
jgi:hypothetical protein